MNKKKQIAIVTGGAKRIGASISRRLHKANIDLIIHYKTSEKEAISLRDELNKQRKNSASLIKADLLDPKSYSKIINETIKIYGQLNFLINNASTYYPTNINQIDQLNWDNLIGSNLKAPLFLCKEAAPFLKKNNGSIINITDAHITKPKENYIIYSIAKAGLTNLTKSLAQELGPEIRVNAVAPGPVLWPENSNEFNSSYRKKVISQTMLKKVGEPDDVAKAVEFLLLNSNFITSHILNVDGGRSFQSE
ncbi:pteridine reductase [Nitrosomonadales bacterium]|nr:pteridine reductase [Nitrosomonadales bacterium]